MEQKNETFNGMKKESMARILVVAILLSLCTIALVLTNQPDPDFKKQWYLYNDETGIDINAKGMWKYLSNAEKNTVVVAIIDTGVDYECAELAPSQWINDDEIESNGIDDDHNGFIDDVYGWSFVDNKPFNRTMIESSHGTMCAGIIAAKHDGRGIEGIVRYGDIKIMPIKVLSSETSFGEGTVKNVIKGIKYAEENGADICNLSLCTKEESQELYKTIKKSKMLFVVSAGNNNFMLRINIDEEKVYPASYRLQNVITVANMTSEGRLSRNSNYGPKTVDVVAPGTDIFCITGKNTYGFASGTSFSTPVVTGVAANIYLVEKNVDPHIVKDIICDTVTVHEALRNKCFSGGFVNGAEALKKSMNRRDYNEKKDN